MNALAYADTIPAPATSSPPALHVCTLPHAHCGCGMVFTAEQWAELYYVGLQEDGDGGFLELRNCPCGSTRAAVARLS